MRSAGGRGDLASPVSTWALKTVPLSSRGQQGVGQLEGGLSDFGIVALVEEELDSFEEDTGCLVASDADCPIRPPGEAEITLYRIFP